MNFASKSMIVLGLGVALQLPAHAAIVDTWNYSVDSLWLSANAGVTLSNSTLSWGTGDSGPSSLVIANPPDSTVDTFIGGGGVPIAFAALGSTLTHNNNPINGTTLTSAVLRSTLSLWVPPALPGDPGATGPTPVELNILFTETPNSGTCTVTSNVPCRDIFVLASPLQNQSFNWDGQDYFVNFFPFTDTLSFLSNDACATVGINSGPDGQRCVGFTTEENQSTDLTFAFTISTLPLTIPEPGSLALAGLALLGAGWMRRRSAR